MRPDIPDLEGTAEFPLYLRVPSWAVGVELSINGQRVKASANKAIADTDWSGCDLVIEASGKMKTVAVLQQYLEQGVKRVVVSAPVKEAGALNVVMGVNDGLYDPAQHRIVTAAGVSRGS